MPHFALIESGMDSSDEALLRARLHWCGGLIRFSRKMKEDGVAALYDAFSAAMWRYVTLLKTMHTISEEVDLDDDATLFRL